MLKINIESTFHFNKGYIVSRIFIKKNKIFILLLRIRNDAECRKNICHHRAKLSLLVHKMRKPNRKSEL